MSRFDGSNKTGVFHVRFQHRQYYFFTQEKRQVSYPRPLNRAWKEKVLEAAANVLVIPSTRARPAGPLTPDSTMAEDDNDTTQQPSPNKCPRIKEAVELETDEHHQSSSTNPVLYWPDSPEARQVFQPASSSGRSANSKRERVSSSPAPVGNNVPEYETAKEALQRRIRLLQSANESEDGWRNVILGRDNDYYCSKLEILQIWQRSSSLCCAYKLALSNMNRVTWHDCCKPACQVLNSLGIKQQATFFKSIANWNKVSRKFECFQNPNPYVQGTKRPLPRLPELYPNAKDQFVSFVIKNLGILTIESVHDFIITSILPRLTSTWQNDQCSESQNFSVTRTTTPDDESAINSFLEAHD